jgi:hypothetical protein
MKNLLPWLKRFPSCQCALLVLVSITALTGSAAESTDPPLALDAMLPLVGTKIKPANFAARFPHFRIPRIEVSSIPDFTRISRPEGRRIT